MPAVQRIGDSDSAGGVITSGVNSVRINNRAVSVDGSPVSPHSSRPVHVPVTANVTVQFIYHHCSNQRRHPQCSRHNLVFSCHTDQSGNHTRNRNRMCCPGQQHTSSIYHIDTSGQSVGVNWIGFTNCQLLFGLRRQWQICTRIHGSASICYHNQQLYKHRSQCSNISWPQLQ